MEMFLMALCMSVFGLAVTAIAFSAATGGTPPAEASERKMQPTARLPLQEPRFFAVEAPKPAAPPRVPIEVLLLQLEHHVRLEQAAAESFLHAPSTQALHSRTTSPLVH
jgi:hypothetical protein